MRLLLAILLSLLIFSCSDEPKEFRPIDMNKIQEGLLEANKRAVAKESQQIDAYVQKKGLEVITTKTGLRYQVYHNVAGEAIKKEQVAVVKYKVNLLDGTECYSTENRVEEFMVAKDYVETGLHEGIQYLSVGDKAKIILPSHLAHGLAGDLKKIPIRSTIIYDIELVAIK